MSREWRKLRLSEVAELNPRRFTVPASDDEIVSFVPMKAVEEETGRMSASGTKTWGEVKKGYTPFQNGDVIFAKITPCMENGKYALARDLHDGRAAGSTEFHVFRPSAELDPKYLLNFLFSHDVRSAARMNMRGAAGQLRVPATFFEALEIPLPSLPEQRSTVAEIEKQFTRLETGIAALKRIQANLKRYRTAVLNAACEGKLVETEVQRAKTEGRSVETGEQLLNRILAERRKGWTGRGTYKEPAKPDASKLPPLPGGWTWTTVAQLLRESLCNGVSVKGNDSPPGVRALRLSSMSDSGFDYTIVRYLPLSNGDVDDLWVQENDFFMSRGNGSLHLVGRGTPAQRPPYPTIFPDTMIRLRLSDAVQRSGWIRTLWPARLVRSQIESRVKTTAGIYKIAQPQVEGMVIPLPPLAEQRRIVAEVERRLSVVEELEATVVANLQRAARLRQSILQKAFSGELVAQESADRSATILPEEEIAKTEESRRLPGQPQFDLGIPILSEHDIIELRAALNAYVIGRLRFDKHLGRTKMEKADEFFEYACGLPLGRERRRDLAGPVDYWSRLKVEAKAKELKWFSSVEHKLSGGKTRVEYARESNFAQAIPIAEKFIGNQKRAVDRIIEVLKPCTTAQCSILATLYAAWNDLLLLRKSASDEAIINEATVNWHPEKRKISLREWKSGLDRLRREDLIPTGRGKPTLRNNK